MTDANLCLGRLLPSHFPHIFGPDENLPLSREAALQAFQVLTAEVNAFREAGPPLSIEDVAMGFIQVANEAMCRPIRALTQVPAPRHVCSTEETPGPVLQGARVGFGGSRKPWLDLVGPLKWRVRQAAILQKARPSLSGGQLSARNRQDARSGGAIKGLRDHFKQARVDV